MSSITAFSVDEDNNVIAKITEPLKSEIIPVVEYIAVHNRLSCAFKEYLIRIYYESNGKSFQKKIEDLEYSSLQIDTDSIRIFLS